MLKMHFHLSRTLTHFPPLPTICSHYPRSIRAPPIAPFAQLFNFSPTLFLFRYCSTSAFSFRPQPTLSRLLFFGKVVISCQARESTSLALQVMEIRGEAEESSSIRRILSSPPFRSRESRGIKAYQSESKRRVLRGYVREDPALGLIYSHF